jgi:hypothetical protein
MNTVQKDDRLNNYELLRSHQPATIVHHKLSKLDYSVMKLTIWCQNQSAQCTL